MQDPSSGAFCYAPFRRAELPDSHICGGLPWETALLRRGGRGIVGAGIAAGNVALQP